jgi:hypothetical protein
MHDTLPISPQGHTEDTHKISQPSMPTDPKAMAKIDLQIVQTGCSQRGLLGLVRVLRRAFQTLTCLLLVLVVCFLVFFALFLVK